MSKVSVVVPTYNYARYLPDCLAGILEQTYQDVEAIIVDDGSTDETPEIVARYAARYPGKVIYLRQERQGVTAATNAGLAVATGEFVGFQGSDDAWLPHKLERQVAVLQEHHEVGWVHSGVLYVDGDGNVTGQVSRTDQPAIGWVFDHLLLVKFIFEPSLVARRELVVRLGGFDERVTAGEDWELELRLARATPGAYIREPLLKYRVHGSNMHRDPLHMERNSLAVLDIVFADKTLPGKYQAMRGRAYRHVYLESVIRYLQQGRREEAKARLRLALSLDPAALFEPEVARLAAKALFGLELPSWLRSLRSQLLKPGATAGANGQTALE